MRTSQQPASLLRYRLAVAARAFAAVGVGYVLSALLAAVLALGLPLVSGMSRVDAVTASMLLAFVAHVCIAIWVFTAGSMWRVWQWLLASSAVLGLVVWWLWHKGGA